MNREAAVRVPDAVRHKAEDHTLAAMYAADGDWTPSAVASEIKCAYLRGWMEAQTRVQQLRSLVTLAVRKLRDNDLLEVLVDEAFSACQREHAIQRGMGAMAEKQEREAVNAPGETERI